MTEVVVDGQVQKQPTMDQILAESRGACPNCKVSLMPCGQVGGMKCPKCAFRKISGNNTGSKAWIHD